MKLRQSQRFKHRSYGTTKPTRVTQQNEKMNQANQTDQTGQIAFECRRCGECCYGEGGITLKLGEAERIAGFLGLSEQDFVKHYCEQRNGRTGIRSGPDGFCCFYSPPARCRIQAVKPHRCRMWPFFPALVKDPDNWEAAKDACPGINPDCTFEDFLQQARAWGFWPASWS